MFQTGFSVHHQELKTAHTASGTYQTVTTTVYGLDGPGSNPGGGRDFPPVQTGPGTHPASFSMMIPDDV